MADDVHGIMGFMLYVFMGTLLTMIIMTTGTRRKPGMLMGVFTISYGKHNGR